MEELERLIGKVLLVGVSVSAVIVAAGAALYLARHGHQPAAYSIFTGEPSHLRSIRGIANSAWRLEGTGIIQLGLLILVAVQLIRVALTAWLFGVTGNRPFVWISLFVLAILTYSLFFQH